MHIVTPIKNPPKVEVVISKTVQILRYLVSLGYLPGDRSHGWENSNDSSVQILIVKAIETSSPGLLWGTWKSREYYEVGTLYLKDRRIGAHGKKWVVEAYGKEFVDSLKQDMERLAKHFSVDIHIRLESDESRQQ